MYRGQTIEIYECSCLAMARKVKNRAYRKQHDFRRVCFLFALIILSVVVFLQPHKAGCGWRVHEDSLFVCSDFICTDNIIGGYFFCTDNIIGGSFLFAQVGCIGTRLSAWAQRTGMLRLLPLQI
jgi:hypothetical protein